MNLKTTFALVGKGQWGKNYISTISKMDDCFLPKKFIKTKNYKDLIKNKKYIDGVIIASPTNTHYKIASFFIKNNLNVLIEKPITSTYLEAIKIKDMVKSIDKDIIVLPGHIQLHDPTYKAIKNNLNKIGKIQQIIFKGLKSPIRKDTTIIYDWGPHPIYIALDLIKQKPINIVVNYIKKSDSVKLILNYKNNVKCTAYLGWNYPKRKREIFIYGSKGKIIFKNNTKKTLLIKINNNTKNINFCEKETALQNQINYFKKLINKKEQDSKLFDQSVETMEILENAQKVFENTIN